MGAGGLALFDFDGTLTTADTFVAFVTFAVPRWRLAAGSLLLGPRGDRVALVSASLDVYFAPFCERHGLDLLSNRLETARGVATGRYLDGDCSGEGKAKRIRARYELSQFGPIYAYGDTPEDEAMLGLADERYYRWAGLGD